MGRPNKRPRPDDPGQLWLAFEAPGQPDHSAGVLAGLDLRISAQVGAILKADARPRKVIAAEMSVVLGQDVSRSMLDKYASASSDDHNISAARFLALIHVTQRHDVLNMLVSPLGAAVIVGEEVLAAQLGSAMADLEAIQKRVRRLKAMAPAIRREARP
jgi:hypothetical protein